MSIRWFVAPSGKNRRRVLNIIKEGLKKSATVKCMDMQRIDLSDDGRHTWAHEVDTEIAEELKAKKLELQLRFQIFALEDGDEIAREDHHIYGESSSGEGVTEAHLNSDLLLCEGEECSVVSPAGLICYSGLVKKADKQLSQKDITQRPPRIADF